MRPPLLLVLLLVLLFPPASPYSFPFWLSQLDSYLTSHTYPIPCSYYTPTSLPLGRWSSRQRSLYNSGKLSHSRIVELEARNFPWSNRNYDPDVYDVLNPTHKKRIKTSEENDIKYLREWSRNSSPDSEWLKSARLRFWRHDLDSFIIKEVERLHGSNEVWGRRPRGRSKK